MSSNLLPFALIRTHSSLSVSGHLIVTPRHAAVIDSATDRVVDRSRALLPSRENGICDALVEFARWTVPLPLEEEDEVYAIVRTIVPTTRRAELVCVNMAPPSIGILMNTLVAWRAADVVPLWPAVGDALETLVAASMPSQHIRTVDDRALDDAPVKTLMTVRGVPIVTATVRPSMKSAGALVWEPASAQWSECAYTIGSDNGWTRQGEDITAVRTLYSGAEIARDVLYSRAALTNRNDTGAEAVSLWS